MRHKCRWTHSCSFFVWSLLATNFPASCTNPWTSSGNQSRASTIQESFFQDYFSSTKCKWETRKPMVQFTSVVIWVPAAAWLGLHSQISLSIKLLLQIPTAKRASILVPKIHTSIWKKWSLFVGIIEAQAILSQAFQVNFWSIVSFEQNQKSFYNLYGSRVWMVSRPSHIEWCGVWSRIKRQIIETRIQRKI